jgi:cell fate regulator YaaT (PSP1 superfamily)
MNNILGIKFRDYGQIYFFSLPSSFADAPASDDGSVFTLPSPPPTIDADADTVLEMLGPSDCANNEPECAVHVGDYVVAETGQGLGLGTVVHVSTRAPADVAIEDIKPIAKITTPDDRPVIEDIARLSADAFTYCTRRIRERELDMKLVDVEVLFDKSKFLFYFTAPTRIDFRELVKDLVREYHVRIELRQIGVRHETQMVGAVGNCGMVCCCRRFLRKFAPVTIKMAKEQNLFLNPTKISGICGRLLCCLSYEQENYDAFHRECPRLGKRYQTTQGDMRVLRANMFRSSIVALNAAGEEVEFTLEEWQEAKPKRNETPAQPKQARSQSAHNDEMIVIAADPDTMDTMDALPDFSGLEEPVERAHPAHEPQRRKNKRKK